MSIKAIIDNINKISGKFSSYQVFTDWVFLSSLSISNALSWRHDSRWEKRENTFLEIWQKYTDKEQSVFCEMFATLVMLLEEEPSDVLGNVFMMGNMGSTAGGQFFTPFHLSELSARLSVDVEKAKQSEETIYMNEPTCGTGGMIIAMAKVLKDAGIYYQKRLKVVAQDLDWRCVHATYVQLSLLGIHAKVIQGDTLAEPHVINRDRILLTPKAMGVLL